MREGGDQFSSAARKFSRVKSQETNSLQNKRRKVELYMEICKRKQKKQKKKTRDFSNAKLIQVQVFYWFTLQFWALPKKLYAFKTLSGFWDCREMVVADKGNSHVWRFPPDFIISHFFGTRRGILS